MIHVLLLQAGGSPYGSIGLMLVMFAIFYFFMIRPQVQKQKKQKTFQESLAKGQQVVTTSGLHGRIEKIEGDTITIQADTKTYLKFTSSAISRELTDEVYNAKATEAAKS